MVMKEKIQLPKKPTGAMGILTWWLRKLFLVGARARCPRCEKGSMFESHFKVRKRCPECKIVFQPYPGDELGVIALGYFITLTPALFGLIFVYLYTDWSAGQMLFFFWSIMTVTLISMYKTIKGIWIAFVYLMTGLRPHL